MEFPLKSNFFPPLEVSPEDNDAYIATAESAVQSLYTSLKTYNWKKTIDKDGITMSKVHMISQSKPQGIQPTGSAHQSSSGGSACVSVCATIHITSSISEVLEAIGTPLTDDYRSAMKFLHKERFLDAMCLQTLAPSAKENESSNVISLNPQCFTTIKWCAFNDGKSLNGTRHSTGTDYCYLEHTGITSSDSMENADDSEFGFIIQESISRESEVPSLSGFGLKRGIFHQCGILILPTERKDLVQVSFIMQSQLDATDLPRTQLENLLARRIKSISRIEALLERRRLSKLAFISRKHWVRDEDRKACAVCSKMFAFRRKHHCRHCGDVICTNCCPSREVDVPGYGVTHLRICTACVVQARGSASTPSITSSSSIWRMNSASAMSSTSSDQASSDEVYTFNVRSTVSSSTNSYRTSSDSSTAATHMPHSTGQERINESAPVRRHTGGPSNIMSLAWDSARGVGSAPSDSSDHSVSSSVQNGSPYDRHSSSSRGSSKDAEMMEMKELERVLCTEYSSGSWDQLDRSYEGAPMGRLAQRAHYKRSQSNLNEVSTRRKSDREDEGDSMRRLLSSIGNLKEDLMRMSEMGAAERDSTMMDDDDETCSISSRMVESLAQSGSNINSAELPSRASGVDTDVDTFLHKEDRSALVDIKSTSFTDQTAGERTRRTRTSLSSVESIPVMQRQTSAPDEPPSELQVLRSQVDLLRTKLADASSKLSAFEAQSVMKEHVDSLENEVRQLEHGNERKRGGSIYNDPEIYRRKQRYNALIGELHEIMGMPEEEKEP